MEYRSNAFDTPAQRPDISLIIPAFNEAGNVSAIVGAISEYLTKTALWVQFVFVDDGSSDGTSEMLLAEAKKARIPFKLIKLSKNCGSHAAMRAGILYADAELCVTGSMDLAEPLERIDVYYNELRNGFEIVYASRIDYRGGLGSRIFASLINKYIEPAYPREGLVGIGFGKKVKAALNQSIENNSSLFFQIFSMGFKQKAIPVVFNERRIGKSKWTLNKKIKLFIDSFVMFSYAPIRIIAAVGLLLALCGLLWALWIICSKLFAWYDYEAGWPMLTSILLIGFGITNISLGVIAEYLVRTLDAARRRPLFIVDEIYTDGSGE